MVAPTTWEVEVGSKHSSNLLYRSDLDLWYDSVNGWVAYARDATTYPPKRARNVAIALIRSAGLTPVDVYVLRVASRVHRSGAGVELWPPTAPSERRVGRPRLGASDE